jgi:hypothetical protein
LVSFPQGFPWKPCTHLSPPPYYMSHLSHSWFHHLHNSRWWIQIIKLTIMHFSPLPCYLSLLCSNIPLNPLFSNTLSLCSLLIVSDQVSHPYKTTGQTIVLYILIFKFLGSKLEDRRFCTEWRYEHFDYGCGDQRFVECDSVSLCKKFLLFQ